MTGSTAFLAGQIGLDPPTMELVASPGEQGALALASTKNVMDECGAR